MIVPTLLAVALLAQPGEASPVLTLEQALVEARRNNLDIQQAEARLHQADQAAAKAWSYYLPQLSVQGSWTYNDPAVTLDLAALGLGPMTFVITPRNQLAAQASAHQAIIAPELWPRIAAAHTGERVAGLGTENARREVLLGVARTYYGAAGVRQLVTVQERTLSLASEREKDARVRFQAGSIPKVAFLRAEIDRAQAEQDLKRAQNQYASAKLALGTLLMHQGEFEVEIPGSPRAPEGDLESAALRERPDVLAAASAVDLARQLRSAAWLRYAPSLGAFGQFTWMNFTGFSGRETVWAAGLAVSWNLLDGGLREAEIREANGKVAEAEVASRAAQARAVEEVRRARLDLESALANRSKAEERVQLARENARLVEVAFRAGAATYLEATDAAESLRQAEISLVAESLASDLAKLQLQKAAGGFGEVAR